MSEVVISTKNKTYRKLSKKQSVLSRQKVVRRQGNKYKKTLLEDIGCFLPDLKKIAFYGMLSASLALLSYSSRYVKLVIPEPKPATQISVNYQDVSNDIYYPEAENHNNIGNLEKKIIKQEKGKVKFSYDRTSSDIRKYFAQFADVTELETRWKINHAKQVFASYADSLDKMTAAYDVPLNFYLAKLGVEGSKKDAVSPTGRKGFSQIYDKSTLEVLLYVGKNEIKEGRLYSDYVKYKKAKDDKERTKIINSIIDNPVKNLEVGVAYCRYLKDIFVDWSLVSAAYQMGPTNFARILHYHKGITTKKWWPQLYVEKDKNRNFIQSEISKYVRENNITIKDIINNEALMANYNNKFRRKYDRLDIYAPWVMKCAAELPEFLLAKGYDIGEL